MRRLLTLLLRFRTFVVFIILQIICIQLISFNNPYQNVAVLNSSNAFSAGIMNTFGAVGEYVDQPNKYRRLNEKYSIALSVIEEYKQKEKEFFLSNLEEDKVYQFKYVPAKVVNNSVANNNNYITIDKGLDHGVKPGMGVVSSSGIVGTVKSCSDGYSTVVSFLHSSTKVSSKIKKTNLLCTSIWSGEDPLLANIIYVPRHEKVKFGDTIVTSGYNAVFPEGINVGFVKKKEKKSSDSFYKITASLATQFNKLDYVFVIKNTRKDEQKQLEENTLNDGQ